MENQDSIQVTQVTQLTVNPKLSESKQSKLHWILNSAKDEWIMESPVEFTSGLSENPTKTRWICWTAGVAGRRQCTKGASWSVGSPCRPVTFRSSSPRGHPHQKKWKVTTKVTNSVWMTVQKTTGKSSVESHDLGRLSSFQWSVGMSCKIIQY